MTQVECSRCREQLDDFLCGELLVETSQAVLSHLARCPGCRREFEACQDLRRRLARVVAAEAPASLERRILEQMGVGPDGMGEASGTAAPGMPPRLASGDPDGEVAGWAPAANGRGWGLRRTLRGLIVWTARRAHGLHFPAGSALTRRAGFAGAVVVLGVLAVFFVLQSGTETLSAAEVIRRADDRLERLLKPGNVLYCRWRRSFVVRDEGSGPRYVSYVNEEWVDGAVPRRAAGRWLLPDGRLALAVWSAPERGGMRVRWFNAGLLPSLTEPDPQDSVPAVYVWPNDDEMRAAVAAYPEAERPRLLEKLRSHEPVVGNQAIHSLLTRSFRSDGLNATAVKVRLRNGRPGIRVTAETPEGSFSAFRGRPFKRIPAHFKGEWYFDAESYLIDTLEREWVTRSGCVIHCTVWLEETTVLRSTASSLPFAFTPPEGTPSVAVDAAELLESVRASLSRMGPDVQPGRSDAAKPPER